MKVNVKKFCIVTAVIWALYILSMGWLTAAGWGSQLLVNIFSSIYIGFSASFNGAMVGALWGLLYGLIGGFLIINAYKRISHKG